MKAFVSLSGGIDSTTVLALACKKHGGENVTAISFDYGQRHAREMVCAAEICHYFEVQHSVVKLDNIPNTMLKDPSMQVPDIDYSEMKGVSLTYVPFRNGLMLATLASIASPQPNSDEKAVIYIGTHAEDAENDAYPDCRLDFIGTMGSAIYIGSYHRVTVQAPLISMYKHEIITAGDKMQVPYGLTWSCYKGEEEHCGICPTCRARRKGFLDARIKDPTIYATDYNLYDSDPAYKSAVQSRITTKEPT